MSQSPLLNCSEKAKVAPSRYVDVLEAITTENSWMGKGSGSIYFEGLLGRVFHFRMELVRGSASHQRRAWCSREQCGESASRASRLGSNAVGDAHPRDDTNSPQIPCCSPIAKPFTATIKSTFFHVRAPPARFPPFSGVQKSTLAATSLSRPLPPSSAPHAKRVLSGPCGRAQGRNRCATCATPSN